MKTRRCARVRIAMLLMWLVPGTVVLSSSSCATQFRDGLVDAAVGFVSDTAAQVLQALFPVADWIQTTQGGAAA